MKALIAALTAPAWTVRTIHEAHQYAVHRQTFADAYTTGYKRGYQAGKDAA